MQKLNIIKYDQATDRYVKNLKLWEGRNKPYMIDILTQIYYDELYELEFDVKQKIQYTIENYIYELKMIEKIKIKEPSVEMINYRYIKYLESAENGYLWRL